jgi:PAS domain S-box-containing protein
VFKELVEQSPGGVCLFDEERFFYVNQALADAFGYRPEEVIGRLGPLDPVHPEDRPLVQENIRRQLSGEEESVSYEFRGLRKDGTSAWYQVLGHRVEYQGRPAIIGTLVDITERMRAEKELRESEERYRRLFEDIPLGVYRTRPDGRILDMNHAGRKLFGFSEDGPLEGERIQDRYVHLEDRQRFQELIAHEGVVRDFEVQMRRRDGEIIWASNDARAVRDRSGRVVFYEGAFDDITTRKRTEEDLRTRTEELATLLELSTCLRKAKSSDEMLPIVLKEVRQQFNADGSWVEFLTPDRDRFTLALTDGYRQAPTDVSFPVEDGICGAVLNTGKPYVTENYSTDPQGLQVEAAAEIGPAVFVPLHSEVELIGVLAIARRLTPETRPFAPNEVSLLTAIGEMVGTALRRQRLFDDAQRRLRQTQALRAIDMAITGSLDLRVTFNVALDVITSQLGIDAAAILLLNLYTQTLKYAAWRGFHAENPTRIRLRLGEGYAGRAALERETIPIPNLAETEPDPIQGPLLAEEGFVTYYAVPLITKGHVQGVLEVFHRTPLEANGEWLAFLETLAGQTAIAIDNVSLFDKLERANVELIRAYDATIEGWGRALDLRDEETEGHSQRVTELTVQLAREMDMSEEALVHARRGALLHDVGKIGIPDSILRKPGKLNDEERRTIERHPQLAYEMLLPIPYLLPALDIPYCHHEKWDGTGYPRGLKGEQIPLAARIFAVADVYDALTSDRPYRKAWPKEKALAYIHEQSGKHFDPRVVEAFFKVNKG